MVRLILFVSVLLLSQFQLNIASSYSQDALAELAKSQQFKSKLIEELRSLREKFKDDQANFREFVELVQGKIKEEQEKKTFSNRQIVATKLPTILAQVGAASDGYEKFAKESNETLKRVLDTFQPPQDNLENWEPAIDRLLLALEAVVNESRIADPKLGFGDTDPADSDPLADSKDSAILTLLTKWYAEIAKKQEDIADKGLVFTASRLSKAMAKVSKNSSGKSFDELAKSMNDEVEKIFAKDEAIRKTWETPFKQLKEFYNTKASGKNVDELKKFLDSVAVDLETLSQRIDDGLISPKDSNATANNRTVSNTNNGGRGMSGGGGAGALAEGFHARRMRQIYNQNGRQTNRITRIYAK